MNLLENASILRVFVKRIISTAMGRLIALVAQAVKKPASNSKLQLFLWSCQALFTLGRRQIRRLMLLSTWMGLLVDWLRKLGVCSVAGILGVVKLYAPAVITKE